MAHDNRQQIGRNSENNTMTKHSTGLVPKLRFPEFRNEGLWEMFRIGDIGKFINGLNGKSSSDFGTGSPFITYKQVFDNSKIEFSECGRVRIYEDENQNTIQYGDILFTTSSETPEEVGFSSIVLDDPTEPTYLNSFCFAIRPYKDFQIRPDFSRFLFHSPFYRKSVVRIAQGSTRYNISKSTFQEIKIPLPSFSEQQKIAACLSSLDELIAAENQKLNLLKEHKKGLLQNLFPQEGEKVPRLRFKEFEKDGEWVEKRLSQILKYGRLGGNYDNSDIKSGIPLIKMGNIDRGNINLEKIQYLPEGSLYDTEDVLKEGDLLFNTRNTLELVGKVAIWRNELPFALYNLNLMRMTFDTKVVHSNYFMNYHFNSPGGIKKLRAIATGTTSVAAIYTKDLLSISFLIPSLSEQQKIASTLSSLDELIQAQTQRIEALQLHKKGLLQGLFPETINN